MAKKSKTNPTATPTPAKKLEVFALKRKEPTPEPESEIPNDAPITQTPEPNVEVANEAPTTPVELPEPSVGLDSSSRPGGEIEIPEKKPVAEIQTITPGAEVTTDAPASTPGTKSVRPVLRKKSERPVDGETSSETRSTPELLEAPPDGAMFQAVGIIVGDVTFDDDGKATVAIAGKDFPLYYAPFRKKAYEALRMEVTKTSVFRQRLLVYPRVIHFPKREQPHNLSFQLVGFFREGNLQAPDAITTDLNEMEFKLSGLWQFIPVCQTPCISVFKNYTTERKDFVKEADVAIKVKFMKGSHVPLMWKDAPVRPFRFNPKLDKEQQGHAAFVQVKAVFVPEKEVFVFNAITSPPASNPPRFLKAGKKDKLQVASDKLKAARGAKGEKVKPQVVKKLKPET